MLKLKKLQMQGFKSFCDRTELQFPGQGVVAVVGPNGCGKSNLADAISWVLGEQSAKSLRGGRMEEVIFAGTRDRAATGMAEVSLTLSDPQEPAEEMAPEAEAGAGADAAGESVNEDGGWGEEEEGKGGEEAAPPNNGGVVLTIRKRRRFVAHNRRGEVVVTRRLYRSGESEYLMNGRPCRLRDIQDLFLGTGLGPESYAIIEQGRIGQILSSKPHERRAIIEEAAGVGKYKAKRRLAEAHLEASRLNLSRINDIFEEVGRQAASLKRQAGKAERYRGLKAEFDRHQRRLVRAKGEALLTGRAQWVEQRTAAQAEIGEWQARIAGQESERAAAQESCAQRERELRRLTEEGGRLQREADQARQQIGFQREQGAELRSRGAMLGQERERLEAQRAGLEAEIQQARTNQDAAGGLAAAARAEQAARNAAAAAAQAEVAGIERELEAVRRRGLEQMGRAAELGKHIAQGEALLSGAERQLGRLEEEEASARADLAAGGERRGQLTLEFQSREGESQELAERARELGHATAQLQAEEAEERNSAQRTRTQMAEAGARRRSLEELTAHHGYSSDAVQHLFGARPAEFRPLGVLGEFLEVEAPYDQVLEQFLHEELNYVVVGSWDQAGAGVGLLRTQEQGRATFLIHAADTEAEAPEAAVQEPGVVALLGQVRALNGFGERLGALLPKLRDAYLTADAGQARRLAGRYPRAYFLTELGECYHHVTVSGGAGTSRGPLSLKRELRQLTQQEQAEAEALARSELRLQELGRQLAQAGRDLEQTRNRGHEVEKQLLSSGQAARQVEQEMERAQARLQRAQLEAARTREEIGQTREALEAARRETAAAEREAEQLRQQEATAAGRAAAAGRRREEAAAAMSAAQAEGARIEERARAAAASCERLEQQGREMETRLVQMRAEAQALEARQRELLASGEELERRVERLERALGAATAAQAEQEAGLAAARLLAQQSEQQLGAGREALEARRRAQNEAEVALARLEAELEHLRQSCRDDLGGELEEIAAAEETAPPEGAELAELEAATRALRQRLDNLGPVNMMALEEYEEAAARHSFMDQQRRDLIDSIADTQKAIQEMDTISRQKFQEAFERINEYFQDTFRVLFGGGQGFLRLSEIEGASESGVDIVAQPPGKKLQNALLLSGGEKAMTAMALLLAVFRHQPSPFCLLDEVDAPMDEANVTRLTEMLRAMGTTTQFILITHNKRTMEAAPMLYGVTMPQAGVSRLVSVLVGEGRPAASGSVA